MAKNLLSLARQERCLSLIFRLKEEGVTVTFDRDLALAREDLEFLTWDHPIVRNGIDLIVSGDIGKR